MKRSDLEKRIRRAARARKAEWIFVRAGAEHDVWRCGRIQVSIPRHREINAWTAEDILKALEIELGEGWWRNG